MFSSIGWSCGLQIFVRIYSFSLFLIVGYIHIVKAFIGVSIASIFYRILDNSCVLNLLESDVSDKLRPKQCRSNLKATHDVFNGSFHLLVFPCKLDTVFCIVLLVVKFHQGPISLPHLCLRMSGLPAFECHSFDQWVTLSEQIIFICCRMCSYCE